QPSLPGPSRRRQRRSRQGGKETPEEKARKEAQAPQTLPRQAQAQSRRWEMRRQTIVLVALLIALALPTAAQADFGIVPDSLSVSALNKNGTVDTQASSHSDSFT